MTKDEALNLALDWFICYQDKSMSKNNAEALADEIITAIKETLAQPWEKFCDSNCVWTDHHPDCKLAQRTWAGLTDEDIGMCLDAGNGSMSKIISFIEAKLKEKNT